jgi:hypothetical protein
MGLLHERGDKPVGYLRTRHLLTSYMNINSPGIPVERLWIAFSFHIFHVNNALEKMWKQAVVDSMENYSTSVWNN